MKSKKNIKIIKIKNTCNEKIIFTFKIFNNIYLSVCIWKKNLLK